jgi:hypothetical protein
MSYNLLLLATVCIISSIAPTPGDACITVIVVGGIQSIGSSGGNLAGDP